MSDTPSKPIIVQPLRDVNINEGETLKLHAAINAYPEPEVIKRLAVLRRTSIVLLDRSSGIAMIFH